MHLLTHQYLIRRYVWGILKVVKISANKIRQVGYCGYCSTSPYRHSVVAKCRLPVKFTGWKSDESIKHNGHFNPSLSRLNLIFSPQTNLLATTLQTCMLAVALVHIFLQMLSTLHGPKFWIVIKEAFICQTSDLIYCISCWRCPALYVRETGCNLRQCFCKHLWSIKNSLPGFPIRGPCHYTLT